MTVTATPAFTQACRVSHQQLVNANNSARDGTGTVSGNLAVGSNGALVDYVLFQAITTTAAGLLRLFLSLDGGTTKRLLAELTYAAVTVSGTVGGVQVTWTPPGGVPFPMPAGSVMLFTFTDATATWNGFLVGGDL